MARSEAVLTITLAALAIGASLILQGYPASVIRLIAIGALMAASLRLVLVFGELNFAMAAFVGIGAYAAGIATTTMQWPFLAVLALSGIVAAAISIPFGYITLRVKGPYFKLIGFAFTEVVRLCYTQSEALGGNSGIVGIFPPLWLEPWMTTFVVGFVIVTLAVLFRIEKSDFGKLLIAVRDNDAVVQTVGINVHLTKVICFAIASFVAGLAGGLQAFVNNVISPGDFGFLLSVFALAYLKVGGEDSPIGPVVGAVLLILLGTLATGFGAGEHIFYGAAIVVAVLFLPKGLVGLLKARSTKHRRDGETPAATVVVAR